MTNGAKQSDSQTIEPGSVFATIKLMLTVFSGLFAILVAFIGVFGWRTISDLDRTIVSTVDRRVGELITGHSAESASVTKEVATLTQNLKEAQQKISELSGGADELRTSLFAIKLGQTDPAGDFLRLQQHVAQNPGSVLEPDTRKKAELVFLRLLDTQRQESSSTGERQKPAQVNAELFYNASGLASEFQMTRLASSLAKLAHEGSDTAEHEARMLRTRIVAGEVDKDQGFDGVFRLVEGLTSTHQIHLTLSEAFNVAFLGGRLSELVSALDALKSKLGDATPSYVWALQAESLLLIGGKAETRRALSATEEALETLATESPRALWFAESQEAIAGILDTLEAHPSYRESASEMKERYRSTLEVAAASSVAGGNTSLLLEGLSQLVNRFPIPPELVERTISLASPTRLVGRGWQWFRFDCEETGTYRISAASGDDGVDPLVVVRSASGELIQADDDGGIGFNALLVTHLEAGSAYLVGVGSANTGPIEGTVLEIRRVASTE